MVHEMSASLFPLTLANLLNNPFSTIVVFQFSHVFYPDRVHLRATVKKNRGKSWKFKKPKIFQICDDHHYKYSPRLTWEKVLSHFLVFTKLCFRRLWNKCPILVDVLITPLKVLHYTTFKATIGSFFSLNRWWWWYKFQEAGTLARRN